MEDNMTTDEKKTVNKKYLIFIVIGIIIILLASLFLFSYFSSSNNRKKCISDNQCSSDSYCSSFGVCLKNVCGDGVCPLIEKQENSCAIDCGCPTGEVLNKHTGTCQPIVAVSSDTVTNSINDYLTKNNMTGKIVSVTDSYYINQTTKEAVVTCQIENSTYPCQIIIYLDNTGSIINAIRTA